MTGILATLARCVIAVAALLCLCALPGYAQIDGGEGTTWWDEEDFSTASVDEGAELTATPDEPMPAIAPDGQSVLDYTPPEPGQDITGLAREILARPEFQVESQVQGESLLERLLRWLSSLPGIPALGSGNWLALSLLAVLLGFLAYLIVRMTWAGRRRGSGANAGAGTGKRGGGAVDYLEQALLAADYRDFRLAVRYRFLSVLQRAGLPDNQLLTNRQVQRQLAKRNASLKRPLAVLITGYEDAWYGELNCTPENYVAVREQAEAVERLLAQEQTA